MNKKLSDKDKKDWQSFVENKDKVENKDLEKKKENIFFEKTIDLHGYTLNDANKKIKDFIEESYNKGVSKINIITLSLAIVSITTIKLVLSPVEPTAPTIMPAVAIAIPTATMLIAPF